MIITTIVNRRLYIQFSSLIKKGSIRVSDHKGFEVEVAVIDSAFEIIDVPEAVNNIHIIAETEEEVITKNFKL